MAGGMKHTKNWKWKWTENSIGDEGAIKISEALKVNTSLNSLILTGDERKQEQNKE